MSSQRMWTVSQEITCNRVNPCRSKLIELLARKGKWAWRHCLYPGLIRVLIFGKLLITFFCLCNWNSEIETLKSKVASSSPRLPHDIFAKKSLGKLFMVSISLLIMVGDNLLLKVSMAVNTSKWWPRWGKCLWRFAQDFWGPGLSSSLF